MKIKHILFLPFIIILFSFGLPKNVHKKVKKEIHSTFNVEDFKLISITYSETLPSPFQSANFFKIESQDNLIGYAYIGKAPSKTDTFEYLILFDSNLIIKKSKILIYREDYGGEIGSKRWLKQFIGKTKDDNLKLHEDIISISGATISATSMTNAVNSVLSSLKILQDKALL